MSSSLETKAPSVSEMVSEDWSTAPWRKLERHVFRLQKRIYRATERGNVVAVHRLQQLLMRSSAARCLAVRKVTQDNRGKNTAGVDGVKSVSPAGRMELVEEISTRNAGTNHKPAPVRRVWIDKPGKAEKRPLGIPTMKERARQALAKAALEPEWEAKFEATSYGYRPGRGAHDAIAAIFNGIRRGQYYVLDADISGCFDHISHEALLTKMETFPEMRRTIKGWLKAGVMDGLEFKPSEEGTPQGGVISPLLANIALHGMEDDLREAYTFTGGKPRLIRYADDFVVLHRSREAVVKAQGLIESWLKGMGLELKPSKTKIVHTLEGDEAGFDLLGFNVRQYRVSKYNSGKSMTGSKTLIKPSKQAINGHMEQIGKIIMEHRKAPQEALIQRLKPVVTGWANYYRTVVSKSVFSWCDYRMYEMLMKWVKSRHRKSMKKATGKYWDKKDTKGHGWRFKAGESKLIWHVESKIVRHVMVRDRKSPYDGDLSYWATRLKDHPMVRTREGRLIRDQKGRCAYCGLVFRPGDVIEIDHIIPMRPPFNGKDEYNNCQAMHGHCHDQKTARFDQPDKAIVPLTSGQRIEEPGDSK